MVPVSLQGLGELGEVAPGRLGGEAEEARHLREDEEAEPVRQVEVAGVLHLLVLAHPVEAQGLGERRVPPEGGEAWGREVAFGPEPLVQDQPGEVGLPVEEEDPFLGGHLPEPP